MKVSVACKATTGVQFLFAGRAGPLSFRKVGCMSPSFLVLVRGTMMCFCKFANATLLHMRVSRRQDRAKPRVGRVE